MICWDSAIVMPLPPQTAPATAPLPLPDDEIHLWVVPESDVPNQLLPHYQSLLSAEELARYQRRRTEEGRRRFLITRATVRSVLSAYHPALAPALWRFSNNAYGRPEAIFDDHTPPLVFNISHATGMVLLAVARRGELGVDVEDTWRECQAGDLARRFFSSAEAEDLLQLPASQQRARFFDLWTLKEAYIKACGMGLAIPLGSFGYRFAGDTISIGFDAARNDQSERWQLWQLRASERHQVGLAYAGQQPMRVLGRTLVPLQSCSALDVQRQLIRYSSTNLEP